ncbi:lytic transglycosylase domain-containing protein [Pseudomonas taiwanensis]|uniref:lytic transglycosylase domain-containing protein n=1 Tax=Pseudomonas taiwanensis TaxID=470150 RepID=UPI0028DEBDD6|nr:lytic transglycosylase domain-containing protein [Pseudomonas taiwanensis]MDT8924963.1 lytic transglycosylase domain-containing protein [Pseudomonas taiwanensis]
MIRRLILSTVMLLGSPLLAHAGVFKEEPVSMAVLNQCVNQSSQSYQLKPVMLKTIIAVEGGRVGTISPNSNGSYDLGVMQVNTLHLPSIKAELGYSWKDLVFDPCKNIQAGSWILSKRLSEVPGKPWLAVGNYHSKTPKFRTRYLKKIAAAYSNLASVIGTPKEASAMPRTTGWGSPAASTPAPVAPGVMVFTDKGVPSLAALEQSIQGANQPQFSTPMARTTPRAVTPKVEVVAINNKRRMLRFIE